MAQTTLKRKQLDDNIMSLGLSRQALINGNFDIWQRGVTSGTMADVTNYYVADRWKDYADKNGGTLPTLTRTRETLTAGELPNSFYYSRLTTNGAGTNLGVSSYHDYMQTIERGTRLLCGDGKTLTISFYARSSIANKRIGVHLQQRYGTGGSPTASEQIVGTNWTLTSSWVKYTHTFTTNTLAGKTFGTDNNDYLFLRIGIVWGTTTDANVGATTAETYGGSGTIDIAQVQICAGSVALPFYPKTMGEELLMCQRYYEKSYDLATNPATVTEVGAITAAILSAYWTYYSFVPFKVRKIKTPAVTIYSTSAGTAGSITEHNTGDSFVADRTGGQVVDIGEGGFDWLGNNNLTPGNLAKIHWTADAEP